jgi:hypothetical protein
MGPRGSRPEHAVAIVGRRIIARERRRRTPGGHSALRGDGDELNQTESP